MRRCPGSSIPLEYSLSGPTSTNLHCSTFARDFLYPAAGSVAWPKINLPALPLPTHVLCFWIRVLVCVWYCLKGTQNILCLSGQSKRREKEQSTKLWQLNIFKTIGASRSSQTEKINQALKCSWSLQDCIPMHFGVPRISGFDLWSFQSI